MNNMAAPPTAAPRMTAVLFWEISGKQREKKHIREIPFLNNTSATFSLVFLLRTFDRGLKLFFHNGASRAAVTAEGPHSE